jgi:4-hydroxy-tetrahydrodipicolinate synthase
MTFEGVYTPVITPFREDESIDEKAWAEVIEYQIETGAHGLVIGGSTGEFYAMSPKERQAQFRKGHELIAGRVPWLGGVNAFTTGECCDFAVQARDAGAAGLLIAAPPYSIPTEMELAAHCLAIEHAAELPIMLYNYPGRTGVNMGEEFLARVGKNANFRGIKETSGDINRVHLIAREFPQIELICGADDQTLEFFLWGARGWVSGSANCILKECLALYEACVIQKDFVKGRRIMMALLPITTVLERGGKFLQCVKYACELQGLPGGAVRKPMRPMKKELARQMRDALHIAQTTVAAIQAEEAPAKGVVLRQVHG